MCSSMSTVKEQKMKSIVQFVSEFDQYITKNESDSRF